ncbi:MAG: DUF1080 domain-containing protein [Planctomycetes bacterium]|nr:DUF1080 domain-containing protein [Planctomycetota bacterium]
MVSFAFPMACTFLASLVAFTPGDPAPMRLGFDKGEIGGMPPGWKASVTGKGAKESVWRLVEDKSAPGGKLALFQTTKNVGTAFNVCIDEGAGRFKDVDVSVSVKAIAGEKDQGGGIVWRAKDKDNFYVVRFNPLEDNFWLYKTVNGVRMSLKKVEVKQTPGAWQTIRVVHKGNRIQCFFNGKMLIDITDDTFTEAGFVGLWSKADAQTYFANVQIIAKKE